MVCVFGLVADPAPEPDPRPEQEEEGQPEAEPEPELELAPEAKVDRSGPPAFRAIGSSCQRLSLETWPH